MLRLRAHAQHKEQRADTERSANKERSADEEQGAEGEAPPADQLLTREGAEVLREALARREASLRAGAAWLAPLEEEERRLEALEAAMHTPVSPRQSPAGEGGCEEKGGQGPTLPAAAVRASGAEAACVRLRVAERRLIARARTELDRLWPVPTEGAGGGAAPRELAGAGVGQKANAAAWALFD